MGIPVVIEDEKTKLRLLLYPDAHFGVMLEPREVDNLTDDEWLEVLRAAGSVGKALEQKGWRVEY